MLPRLGWNLLCDPPTSASWVARVTGMDPCKQLDFSLSPHAGSLLSHQQDPFRTQPRPSHSSIPTPSQGSSFAWSSVEHFRVQVR